MLELRDLEIRQDGFSLSANCTLDAPFTALIGPSGAGKSTVLNAIAGFVNATSGQILWRGQDIGALPPARRPVSILFQDNNLFPHLSIAANLALALTTKRPSKAQQSQVEQALAEVGLKGFGTRKPAALSGGQQGRAALARVLLQDRPLMLLDEPFAALGPALRTEMLELVSRLAAEASINVVMVSHAPEDAQRVANETVLITDGRMLAPQETNAFFATPSVELTNYLGA